MFLQQPMMGMTQARSFTVPGWMRFAALLIAAFSIAQLVSMNAYEKDLALGLFGLETLDPKVTGKNVFYASALVIVLGLLFESLLPWLIGVAAVSLAVFFYDSEFRFRGLTGVNMNSLPGIANVAQHNQRSQPQAQQPRIVAKTAQPARTTNKKNEAARRWNVWGKNNGWTRGLPQTAEGQDWCTTKAGYADKSKQRMLNCLTGYVWQKH